jgi:hypothetical protein
MNPLFLAVVISIQKQSNDVLAAACLALDGFGYISQGNRAFGQFTELGLINKSGNPVDGEVLLDVISFEVNRRVGLGTFN